MAEENVRQEFRLKNINETRSYVIEKINWNKLVGKKHETVWKTLNHTEHFLILGSTISGCVSISAFAHLVGIPIWITSFAIGLKICVMTAGIKKYKWIIKEKKKKHYEIVLLGKLNSMEVLFSKALISSVIRHE